MNWKGRKVYGQSKVAGCPFCGKQAFSKNAQDVPVCKDHTEERMPDIRCACGKWLDMKIGKWGPFFVCIDCGIINMKKAMELLDMQGSSKGKQQGKVETKAAPKTKEAEEARKFEEMSQHLKKCDELPSIDDLADQW